MKKYTSQIRFISILLVLLGMFFFMGEIILPFIIGLLLAYVSNPVVKRIQRIIPNRSIAVSTFLIIAIAFFIGSVSFLGIHVVNDVKRLSNAFISFSENNSETIDKTSQKIKSYIEIIYPRDTINKSLNFESITDSLSNNSEVISETLSEITSFISSPSKEGEDSSSASPNWLIIFTYSVIYFLYILYTYPYFDGKFNKYFGGEKSRYPYLNELKTTFNSVMSTYMRQRSLVVLICIVIFIGAFSVIGLPGAIILGVFTGILCYVSHFHYYTLIPLSLSCWVLSIEQGHSFFLYFGVLIALFIIVSILEELIFFPKIMKGVSNMNPAIMMLSLIVCNYLFGITGLLIALPLTSVFLIYLDKLLMHQKLGMEE